MMRGGIEFSDIGEPLAYHVRQAHPGDWYAAAKDHDVGADPAATAWGRPLFIHGFEAEREGQSRAISPFACAGAAAAHDCALRAARIEQRCAQCDDGRVPDLEPAAGCGGAQLTPGSSTIADKRISHYTKFPPTMAGVRIPVLQVGDEIKMNARRGRPRRFRCS
jgi:capsid protein